MKKRILGLLGACLLLGQAIAQEPDIKANYPEQYTVVKGDTLWDISSTFLNNPWMWPEIWHVNPQISNPHLIYPGDVIRLVYFDGKPRLVVDTSNRVVKLSPEVRVIDADQAIPAIPLNKINNFLSRSRIVTQAELDRAPHVVSGEAQRLVLGKGDRLYARGQFDDDVSVYGVYRKGDIYVDPETGELLGIQAIDIGSGRMRALDGEIATLLMTRTTEEVRVGDRLLADESRTIDSTFFPSAPKTEVNAQIIAVEGGVTQVGKMDVVVINRGDREGMEVGNVLAVYKRGGKVKDRVKGDIVTLPDERAGLVMVFRTFEKLSLGLVLEADRPLAIKDLVRNP
ncbi:LysM peptidoglycan-binding domain-containing protein [Saccharophagus sp. K07]|jgi:nucleoid-associated protein YgaU|uniref:LysM peptidoglycan-binding domain-containing protein n=1 Tax=Saccharophagus sp. K07 TaxID=2283636 RepID=UPI0016524EE5|nr:LysM peptidoglycan-binding domain-containing protein [Saccharophagus sp. K07]MBC6906166.1 LysM peptidoglycan-binding domain-containing protein [Saccharophagus sp. K07]